MDRVDRHADDERLRKGGVLMHLLSALASGIRGAENGYVGIYSRGTTTPAALYTGFDGSGGYQPSGAISLDANGSVVRYVNEMVDCQVLTSQGVIVSEFTDGVASPAIEVISQSFTGTSYDSGASAVGNPTTAQALFDLWVTQNGAPDWKVLFGGASSTIPAALASFVGLFYNVKSPAYGAVGNGSSDDTSAVQAAINAAVAGNGGIVFFPPGSYRLTSTLSIGLGVSLMGCGAATSGVTMDSAGANTLTFTYSDPGGKKLHQYVFGLTITTGHIGGNSGKVVVCETGNRVDFLFCELGGDQTTSSSGTLVSLANAETHVSLYGCTLRTDDPTAFFVNGPAAGRLTAVGCTFFVGATSMTTDGAISVAGDCFLTNCRYDISNLTGGAGLFIRAAGSGTMVITGGIMTDPGGATAHVPFRQDGATPIHEIGLRIPSTNISVPSSPGVATTGTTHQTPIYLSRDHRRGYVASDAGAITIPAQDYGQYEVRRTNNGAQTVAFDPPSMANQLFTLVYNNDHAAGGGTITPSGTKGIANFTVNANRASILTFVSAELTSAGGAAGNYYWAFVANTANVTL